MRSLWDLKLLQAWLLQCWLQLLVLLVWGNHAEPVPLKQKRTSNVLKNEQQLLKQLQSVG
nr:MAG TPA: hypothetical protein [Caudoviricetes sp.]